jgi:3-(3-hydroxy-phenyl)propionate hydroxylase
MADVAALPVWREMGATPKPPLSGPEELEILIVGAGPVGLALALDLGSRGHRVVVVTKLDFITAGSKAICFAKRSLDIFDRLGVGDALVAMGVTWNVGKVFWGDRSEPVQQFDLLPVKDQHRPAFINLQQYRVEDELVRSLAGCPNVELRWGHEVTSVRPGAGPTRVDVATAEGSYAVDAHWLIACDGSRSRIRSLLGLEFEGRTFEDNFLIADVRFEQERPSERWFWFDPPFNPGQSALLHKQPEGIWRLDFQIGADVDADIYRKPENIEPLIRAMLGEGIEFSPVWYSVYTFQCRRMDRFVHGNILFAGDSAHLVSPFGARGCNGGLADIDNLGWKLDLVCRGQAPDALLETYNYEAIVTADENILKSSQATDFMTPKTAISRVFRDAALELALEAPFASAFVNSGRLSTAVSYPESPLNSADVDGWNGGVAPGAPMLDAPLGDGWLLDRLGNRFVLLADQYAALGVEGVEVMDVAEISSQIESLRARLDLEPGAAYLVRPDQYVAARWKHADPDAVEQALRKAKGVAPCPA